MLVNGVQQNTDIKKVSFKGIQKTKDSYGYESYDLFLPYDKSKYDLSVEIVKVIKEDGEWHPDKNIATKELQLCPDEASKEAIKAKNPNAKFLKKDPNGNKFAFDPSTMFLKDQSFGYRFKLTDKVTGKATYHTDNGIMIGKENPNEGQFIIIHRNKAPGKMPGVMIHGLADNFNPGFKMENGKPVAIEGARKNLLHVGRTHFNNYGGNLAGMIQKIPELSKMGYTQYLSTPLFGADEMSSHGYWTTNVNQINKKFGNLNDFRVMAATLHKHGMTFFADGAVVNEGIEGIHYKYNLKWGEKSPFRHYIKGDGYKKPSVLPDIDASTKAGREEIANFKIKVINGDKTYSYTDGNMTVEPYTRDKTQPTYVQIYDKRLAPPEQVKKNEPITRYENLETDNHFDIAIHNDSVLPFKFEIPEDELAAFHKRMEENQDLYKSGDNLAFLQTVLKFPNFQIGTKGPGNANNWDGNADVFKMNFTYTNKDEQELTLLGASAAEKQFYEQSTFQVQDMTQKAGIYWTRIYGGAVLEHDAKALTNELKEKKLGNDAKAYKEALNSSELHPSAKNIITDDVIKNVLSGQYRIPQLEKSAVPKERLCESIMNYPLTAIEFSPDLTAVLDTPYLSKKAHTEADITKTRSEFFKANDYNSFPKPVQDVYYEMDQLYANLFTGIANRVLEQADKDGDLGLLHKDGDKERQLTDKGKLVLPLIADDITKFLVVKAFAPDVKVTNNDGVLEYDESIRKVGLKNLNGGKGISARTPQEEAEKVFKLLKAGLSEVTEEDKKLLSDSIKDRFQGISPEAMKMSYVIVDKTEAGMNWRTDATKDEIEVDNVRNGLDEFGEEWNKSILYWKGFIDGIRKENPNSIIITEMTDMEDSSIAADGAGRFKNNRVAETMFVEETGATTISNYVMFSNSQQLLTRDAETGKKEWDVLDNIAGFLTGQADWSADGQLHNTSADGVRKAHNFIGNHDKPRLLHTLALDMSIFHNHPDPAIQKNIKYLGGIYAKPVIDKGLSPDTKALAMAHMIDTHMMPVLAKAGITDAKAEEKLRGAICDLVQGEFLKRTVEKGNTFDAEHFGAEDPEFAIRDVIIQAKHKHGLVLDKDQTQKLEDFTRESALKEAMEKSLTAKKFLMVMPGDYTEYAGDSLGMGGYEAACKNIHVKNRGIIPWEYLDEAKHPDKQYIRKYHEDHEKKLNDIRRKEGLSALGNGETHRLGVESSAGKKVLAMFRYNDVSELVVIAHELNINANIPDLEALAIQNKGVPAKDKIKAPHEFVIDYREKSKPTIDSIDVSAQDRTPGKNGTVIAGLAGGLAIGTMFKDALDDTVTAILGVCKDGTKHVLRQFESEGKYIDYLNKPEAVATLSQPIKLEDNVVVLKKFTSEEVEEAAKNALKNIHFKGRTAQHNPNYFQIQAYLNSKTHLNAESRYTSIAK